MARSFYRRGGKRSRARAPKGPVNTLCHKICYCNISLLCNFMVIFICFKRVFARIVDFDDSIHVRNQTVVLIFLIYGNWFYPNQSVVGVVGCRLCRWFYPNESQRVLLGAAPPNPLGPEPIFNSRAQAGSRRPWWRCLNGCCGLHLSTLK